MAEAISEASFPSQMTRSSSRLSVLPTKTVAAAPPRRRPPPFATTEEEEDAEGVLVRRAKIEESPTDERSSSTKVATTATAAARRKKNDGDEDDAPTNLDELRNDERRKEERRKERAARKERRRVRRAARASARRSKNDEGVSDDDQQDNRAPHVRSTARSSDAADRPRPVRGSSLASARNRSEDEEHIVPPPPSSIGVNPSRAERAAAPTQERKKSLSPQMSLLDGCSQEEDEGDAAMADLERYANDESLVRVTVRNSSSDDGDNNDGGDDGFLLPASLIVSREKEMRSAASAFGVGPDRWGGSLLARKLREDLVRREMEKLAKKLDDINAAPPGAIHEMDGCDGAMEQLYRCAGIGDHYEEEKCKEATRCGPPSHVLASFEEEGITKNPSARAPMTFVLDPRADCAGSAPPRRPRPLLDADPHGLRPIVLQHGDRPRPRFVRRGRRPPRARVLRHRVRAGPARVRLVRVLPGGEALAGLLHAPGGGG